MENARTNQVLVIARNTVRWNDILAAVGIAGLLNFVGVHDFIFAEGVGGNEVPEPVVVEACNTALVTTVGTALLCEG